MPRKLLTIPELANLLAWQAFGQSHSNKWMHELQFIMGRGGNKHNDDIRSVLEDILRNV